MYTFHLMITSFTKVLCVIIISKLSSVARKTKTSLSFNLSTKSTIAFTISNECLVSVRSVHKASKAMFRVFPKVSNEEH